MKRLFVCSLLLIFAAGLSGAFAQDAGGFEFLPTLVSPVVAFSDALIPGDLRNNQYFLESVRYTNMAQAAYEEGDYDASIRYSQEAVRFARLSDEFVVLALRIKEADTAIAAAQERMAWASSAAVNAQSRFPDDYNRALLSLETAVNYRRSESWENAILFAYEVINALAYVNETGAPPVLPPSPSSSSALPAQYTVRDWNISGDCLWNIAGRPWVYGDPTQWRLIYDMNRSKLPDPNNPDLIEPGLVLDIPSLMGETRQGSWDAGAAYTPFNR